MSKSILNNMRKIPKKRSDKTDILFSAGIIALGIALGYISKATDAINIIGEITTELGIWVFISALIAAYSKKPLLAAINVTLFFIAMLCSYYLYGYLILGFFPKAYFLGWLCAALISSVFGFAVWFSKGKDITAVIASAIPISVLYAWGYPAFYTYKISLFVTLAFGIILNVMLPHTKEQKIIVFICSAISAFIIVKFNLLSYLPF